ncbi:RidA family protein [Candidatus Peregrinibacteria bacterium]|nr:RidA family protein [Candidatus Peregrinibacteria bacterium]
MKIISSNKSPKAIGPYSQGIISGNLFFCSGQIGLTQEGALIGPGIDEQTVQILNNLKNILEAGGSCIGNVLKTTLYLTDLEHFKRVNEIYASFFGDHKPARATVQVSSLPKGALIEIDCIATMIHE